MQSSGNKVFNILHVVSRLPIGGVENMLLRVIKGYDKKRFTVSVCCIKEGGEIADELKRLGYKVEILNKMKSHGFNWSAVFAIYYLIKRKKIHILRTHQYHANLYGRIAGLLARVPVIIPSFHNLYESPNNPKFHRRIFNYILSFFSDVLVAVSNTVASDIIRFDWVNPEKIKIIYNGIESEEFNITLSKEEARKALELPLNCTIIGTVGRLTEQKGHRYLIEATLKLGDTCVVIAGDGPLTEELKNLTKRFRVNSVFLGRLSYKKIPLFLRSIDIFCFPSLWEGLPSALIEAMATGLPVVATDIRPLREVVGDAGILVPPRDREALTKTMKMLIDTPSLRDTLSKKAKERARIFIIENTVKAYAELFEKILRKKKLL